MKKIGIIVGREKSLPMNLIPLINKKGEGEIVAELAKFGGTYQNQPIDYNVILDRISHDYKFYRAIMKMVSLQGVRVINNPFWYSADDKFFEVSLAERLKIPIPKTIILPSKNHPEDITSESLRNLIYPLNWEEIFDYIGFPAILKPYEGGGWRDIYKVKNAEEFFYAYDQTNVKVMMLQEFINYDKYVRGWYIGGDVILARYEPAPYLQGKYIYDPDYISKELADTLIKYIICLNESLGYEVNAVEFAIKNDIPYAIDFLNPVCDMEKDSVGEYFHNLTMDLLSNYLIKIAKENEKPSNFVSYKVEINLKAIEG